MTKNLKNCPFCGGEAVLTSIRGLYRVKCIKCDCSYRSRDNRTEKDAIEAWNQREPMDRVREMMKERACQTFSHFDDDGFCEDDSKLVVYLEDAREIIDSCDNAFGIVDK